MSIIDEIKDMLNRGYTAEMIHMITGYEMKFIEKVGGESDRKR